MSDRYGFIALLRLSVRIESVAVLILNFSGPWDSGLDTSVELRFESGSMGGGVFSTTDFLRRRKNDEGFFVTIGGFSRAAELELVTVEGSLGRRDGLYGLG